MEDAHICEPNLYAVLDEGGGDDTDTSATSSGEENGSKKKKQKKISKLNLPGHSLFAVFDGASYDAADLSRNFAVIDLHF